MIRLKDILSEGVEAAYILKKDAEVKYNKKPTGGTVGALQFASQGYVKVPKGTFLVGLPGGLFAVNMSKKKPFAFALTNSTRDWLGAQDKLKDDQVLAIPRMKAPTYSQWRGYLS